MFCVVKNLFPSLSLETKASCLWKKERNKSTIDYLGKKLQSAWVVQIPIKLTPGIIRWSLLFILFVLQFGIWLIINYTKHKQWLLVLKQENWCFGCNLIPAFEQPGPVPSMGAWQMRQRRVYNIRLISISDTVFVGATKTLVLNIERSRHDKLSQGIWTLFATKEPKISPIVKFHNLFKCL